MEPKCYKTAALAKMSSQTYPKDPIPWPGPFRDRDLNPPLSTVTLCMKDFVCLERPFQIWSRRPCAQGVGVDRCLLKLAITL